MTKDCDKCVFEEPCILCVYINKRRLFGKPKPLKFSPNVEEVGLGNKWMDWYDIWKRNENRKQKKENM